MNKWIVKPVALGMIVLMACSNMAFATNSVTPAMTELPMAKQQISAQTVRIQYKQALELMYAKNKDVEALQSSIKLQDEAIKEAENNVKRYKNIINSDEDKAFDRAKIVYLDPITVANAKKDYIRRLEDKKVALAQTLMQYYVNYKKLEDNISLYNEILKIQAKDYSLKQAQFKAGKITFKDLSVSNINYQLAQLDIDKYKRDAELMNLNLKNLINNSFDMAYTFDASNIADILKVPNVQMSDEELKAIIENNKAKDSALAKLDDTVKVIEETKRLQSIYMKDPDYKITYDEDLKDNRDDYKDRVQAIEFQVYSDYYILKTLMASVNSADENIKLANMKYDVNKVLYAKGNLTELELVKSKKDVKEAEYYRFVALYELYQVYTVFMKYSN